MRRDDLLHQLAALTVQLPAVLPPASTLRQATALCATARVAFGAAAVSVAALHDDVLRYLAADGEGATEIVGTELPVSRGLAGYVALSGQSLAVDRATDDPRFARDVAERTGYIPTSLLVVPIRDPRGEVIGVLSVLDRSLASADALVLASTFADQLSLLLPTIDEVGRTAQLLLDAIVDAVNTADPQLAPALRRALARRPGDEVEAELAGIAATLNELRSADAATRARVGTLVAEIVALATIRRRR